MNAPAASSPDSLLGLALLGKVAFAFALVVASILACGWLAKRLGARGARTGQPVQVVSSTGLGQRERVVIVQVLEQWLVLGVTAQQVNLLTELPAPAQPAAPAMAATCPGAPFAERLAHALKQRLRPAPEDTKPS